MAQLEKYGLQASQRAYCGVRAAILVVFGCQVEELRLVWTSSGIGVCEVGD